MSDVSQGVTRDEWVPPDENADVIDGRNPADIEHLCIDLTVKDEPVDQCCAADWRADGVEP